MDELSVAKITSLSFSQVLLAGDFMLDEYLYADAERISPEAPVPVLKVVSREFRCGGAASVAAALAAMGSKPICVGVIGDDERGNRLKGLLDDIGADTSGLIRVAGRPTTTKQRLVGVAQHRHRQQLMRIDDESDEPLSTAVYDRLATLYGERVSAADVVCLQDYAKGVLSLELTKVLFGKARDAGKLTLADPHRSADFEKYRGAGLITPNRFEASQAVGFSIRSEQDANRAAGLLRTRYEIGTVIITLDREGMYVASADDGQLIPTHARSVYDVTGAGDVVLAALAVALAAGWNQSEAASLANLAAGIAVGKFGTATVSMEEILWERQMFLGGQRRKLLPLESLLKALEVHRQRHETIVFTNGCFDVLHQGHTSCLNFCKEHGDVVIVGLNSDTSVRILKGPTRPVNKQDDRAAVLAALEAVDYVVVFDDPSVFELVQAIRPDVLVKGADCKNRDEGVVGREFVESYGGEVLLAPLAEGRSTTSTIARIRSEPPAI